jgi:hypothetical protein
MIYILITVSMTIRVGLSSVTRGLFYHCPSLISDLLGDSPQVLPPPSNLNRSELQKQKL